MFPKVIYKPVLFYIIIFLIGSFFVSDIYVWGKHDRSCWFTWSNFISNFGIENIYKFKIDYPPLVTYLLWVITQFNPTPERLFLNIFHTKYIVLFFEIISIYFAYLVLYAKKIKYALFLPLLILFNVSFWYNNLLFGQMDGIYSGFAFISLALVYFKKPSLSIVFYVLCFNFKFQGIIFLPLLSLLYFNEFKTYTFKKIIYSLLPGIILQILLLLPFILIGDLKLAINSCTESLGRYPIMSMGAYNFWYIIFKKAHEINDYIGIFRFSYNSYGLMLFFGLSGLTLLPLSLNFLNIGKRYLKKIDLSFENILLVSILIILFFFFFNTQMHARYSHPLIIFSGVLSILKKDYLKFSLVSIAVFLNMEGASKIFKGNIVEYELLIFQPWFVALIFLTILLLYMLDYIKVIKAHLSFKSIH